MGFTPRSTSREGALSLQGSVIVDIEAVTYEMHHRAAGRGVGEAHDAFGAQHTDCVTQHRQHGFTLHRLRPFVGPARQSCPPHRHYPTRR